MEGTLNSLKHQQKILQEKQLDYTVVFLTEDEDRAVDFDNRLKDIGLDGRLYDDKTPFDWSFGMDQISILSDLMSRSTYVFFCVSNHFANPVTKADDFVLHKNEAVLKSLRRGYKNIIPVWLDPKKTIKEEAERNLYGLMPYGGIDPNSKYFSKHLQEFAESEKIKTGKQKREIICQEELERLNLPVQIKEQERKLEEFRKNQPLVETPKNGYPVIHGGNGVINNYNVQIHNSKDIRIGDTVAGNAQAQAHEQVESQNAPSSFWSSLGQVNAEDAMAIDDMETDGGSTQNRTGECVQESLASSAQDALWSAPASNMTGSNTGPLSTCTACMED